MKATSSNTTVLVIQPHVVQLSRKDPNVLQSIEFRLHSAGFDIAQRRCSQWTRKFTRDFFRYQPEGDNEDFITYMCSAPCVALQLTTSHNESGDNSAASLNSLLGPEAACKKNTDEKTLRELHGIDENRSGFYVSKSSYRALVESCLLFPVTFRGLLQQAIVIISSFQNDSRTQVVSNSIQSTGGLVLATTNFTIEKHHDNIIINNDDANLIGKEATAILVENFNILDSLSLVIGPELSAETVAPLTLRGQIKELEVLSIIPPSTLSSSNALPTFFKDMKSDERTIAVVLNSSQTAIKFKNDLVAYGFTTLKDASMKFTTEMATKLPHLNIPTNSSVSVFLLSRRSAVSSLKTLLSQYYDDDISASESQSQATIECKVFFNSALCYSTSSDSSRQLKDIVAVSSISSTTSSFHEVLSAGLAKLCVENPSQDACEWLGKWLLENNPNKKKDKTAAAVLPEKPLSEATTTSAIVYPNNGEKLLLNTDDIFIVAVFGPPGSGVTTRCKALEGYYYIDAQAVSSKTFALDLEKQIKRCASRKVVLDNFPLDLEAYYSFKQRIDSAFDAVFHLTTEDTAALRRRYINDCPVQNCSVHATEEEAFDSKLGTYEKSAHSFFDSLPNVTEIPVNDPITLRSQFAFIQSDSRREHYHGFTVTSTLDIVKEYSVKKKKSLPSHISADTLKEYVRTGQRVPNNVVNDLFRLKVEENPRAKYLISGLPDSLELAILLDKTIGPPVAILVPAGKTQRGAVSAYYQHRTVLFNPHVSLVDAIAPYLQPRIGFALKELERKQILEYQILSPKKLLKAEVRCASDVGKEIEKFKGLGQPVPSDIVITVLSNAIQKLFSSSRRSSFIIEDFPRSVEQAILFEKQIAPCQFAVGLEEDNAVAHYLQGKGVLTSNDVSNTLLLQTSIHLISSSDPQVPLSKDVIEKISSAAAGYRVISYNDLKEDDVKAGSKKLLQIISGLFASRVILLDYPVSVSAIRTLEEIVTPIEKLVLIHPKIEKAIVADSSLNNDEGDDDDAMYYSDEEDKKEDDDDKSFSELTQVTKEFDSIQVEYQMFTPKFIKSVLEFKIVGAFGYNEESFQQTIRNSSRRHKYQLVNVQELLETAAAARESKAGLILANDGFAITAVVRVIKDHLQCNNQYGTKFILSGFPRMKSSTGCYPNNVHDQLFELESQIAPMNKVLYFENSPESVESDTDNFLEQVEPVLKFFRTSNATPFVTLDSL